MNSLPLSTLDKKYMHILYTYVFTYVLVHVCVGMHVSLSVCLSLSLSLFALLCFARGLEREQSSRPAGALPHPSFGMDGLGLYRTVCPWCSEVLALSLSLSVCLSVALCLSLTLSRCVYMCPHTHTHSGESRPMSLLRGYWGSGSWLCALCWVCAVSRDGSRVIFAAMI